MLDINLSTPSSMMETLQRKYKQKRLEFDLTQEGLADKSSVSLGSLKRFESTGKISLESLLKISMVLECLEDFQTICTAKKPTIHSIDELFVQSKSMKKRGRKK